MAFSMRVAAGEVCRVISNMGVTLSTGAGHARVAIRMGMGAAERVRRSGGPRAPPRDAGLIIYPEICFDNQISKSRLQVQLCVMYRIIKPCTSI